MNKSSHGFQDTQRSLSTGTDHILGFTLSLQHVHVYRYTCIYMYRYMYMYNVYTCTGTCVYMCVPVHVYTYTGTYIHVYCYLYIHVYRNGQYMVEWILLDLSRYWRMNMSLTNQFVALLDIHVWLRYAVLNCIVICSYSHLSIVVVSNTIHEATEYNMWLYYSGSGW